MIILEKDGLKMAVSKVLPTFSYVFKVYSYSLK